MKTSTVSPGKSVKVSAQAISLDETIALFDVMEPSEEVVMRRDMEQMFPSISAAMKREVSEGQIIAALRQKWPGTHVSTLIKLFNAERARRLAQDEHIACKPFGTPRKPKMRRATKTADTSGSARTPPTAPDVTNSDKHEVSA